MSSNVCVNTGFFRHLLFLILVGLSLNTAEAQEGIPKLKSAVNIEGVQVIGTPKEGKTFIVEVKYKSNIESTGNIVVAIPEHHPMSTSGTISKKYSERIALTKNSEVTKKFEFNVYKKGSAMLEVHISVPESPP